MKYNLSRSITIDAPLDKVRPHIADFKNWTAWSPWTIIEPDHESRVEGEAGKVGSKMYWNGEVIGEGQMTLEKVDEHHFDYKLEFFKPFKTKSETSFKLEKEGDKTKVTWAMDGNMPFFLFFMIKTMKAWIEMDYDRGLKMMKAMVEKGKINAKTTNEGVVDYEGFSYVGIQKTSAMEDMPKEMGAAFKQLMEDLQKNGVQAEKWISVYTKMDLKNKTFTYIAGASDENLGDKDLGADYVKGEVPTGKSLKINHKGSYEFLGNAWSMGSMYLQAKKLKGKPSPFEFYLNNPNDTKEDDLMTDIYFPLK